MESMSVSMVLSTESGRRFHLVEFFYFMTMLLPCHASFGYIGNYTMWWKWEAYAQILELCFLSNSLNMLWKYVLNLICRVAIPNYWGEFLKNFGEFLDNFTNFHTSKRF